MMLNWIGRPRHFGTFLAQWRRQTIDSAFKRSMCNKPVESGTETKSAAPTKTTHLGFKLPGFRPSEFDKKMLIWSGRFKTKEQIPDIVSYEMLDAARNRVRVKVAYLMMGATILACLCMVYVGKQGVKNHDSLISRNMEKKARWREEAQRSERRRRQQQQQQAQLH